MSDENDKHECNEYECIEKNIAIINGELLCLDCGEKVEQQLEVE